MNGISKGISKSLLITLFTLAALFTHGLSSAQQDHIIAPPRPMPPLPRPPLLKVPAEEKPVELVKYGVQVRISGLESETTTTMVFRNPNARLLAGELEFPLPDGAAVAGYALDVNGRMVDGVAVTREKARVAVETEMRRRVDPGLVEHVRGNFFRTRIYPVPAGGERTVRVTTVAPLALSGADAAYHLPLPRVSLPVLNLELSVAQGPVKPELGGFGDLTLTEWSGQWAARTELKNITPGDDLYVRLPKVPAQFIAVEETGGQHFLAIADRPELPAQTAPPSPARLALAWDASGSRSPEAVGRDIAILGAALSAWRDCTVDLVVFRDQPEPVKTFSVANGKADQLLDHLQHLAYDGGTNLAALDLSKKAAPNPQVAAWLLFTDGLYTMGSGLPAHGGLPVQVVASDERRDIALQRFLAEATTGQFVDGATLAPESAAALLKNPPATLLRVEAPAGALADIQYRFLAGAGRAMVYARLLAATAEVTLVYGAAGHEIARSTCSVRRDGASPGRLLARAWAGARAEALSVFPERNADRLLELGQRYGLVTPGTSLLVLENLQQYLRHKVMPPESWPEMREQYLAALKNNQGLEQGRRLAKIDQVLAWWKARVAWWERDFSSPQQAHKPPEPPPGDQEMPPPIMPMREPMPAPAPAEAAKMARESAAAPARATSGVVGGAGADSLAKAEKGAEGAASAIVVKAWDPATPYLAAIKARPQEQAYAAYLAERPAWAQSPAFYLDCAGYLLPRDRALGLRVLSNLAELQIDDAALLRVFAWRLREAGELDRAIEVLEKVRSLRPEEPQSHRDLALAVADRLDRDGRIDDGLRAAELLNTVITGEWQRFAGIEVVTLMELNRLLAVIERLDQTALSRLDYIDKRLRKLLDLDVRIVLSWDADNTDIDLHVVEPAGEEAFYGHQQTARGGLVSMDFTQGYGPEEYVLRRAPAGAYRIRCNYFASSQQTLVGPATVVATVFTGYGRPTEKRQILTLRLDQPRGQGKEMADIGEIVIGPGAGPAKASPRLSREMVAALAKGATRAEVETALGPPEREDSGALTVLIYHLGDATELRLGFGPDLLWAREVHPGAEREVQLKER